MVTWSVAPAHVGQGPERRVVAVHAVHTCPGRRGRRADEHPGDARAVGIAEEARPEEHLHGRVRATDDVAADVVAVRLLQLGRRLYRSRDDPLAEAGREAFDLRDQRLAYVAAE